MGQELRIPRNVDLDCGLRRGEARDWLCGRWGERGGLGDAKVENPQEGVGGDAADEVSGVGREGGGVSAGVCGEGEEGGGVDGGPLLEMSAQVIP